MPDEASKSLRNDKMVACVSNAVALRMTASGLHGAPSDDGVKRAVVLVFDEFGRFPHGTRAIIASGATIAERVAKCTGAHRVLITVAGTGSD